MNSQKEAPRTWSVEKVFFKTSQNSQENSCVRVSFFNNVAGLSPATYCKSCKNLIVHKLLINYLNLIKESMGQLLTGFYSCFKFRRKTSVTEVYKIDLFNKYD